MLNIEGRVMNVFHVPAKFNERTGEEQKGYSKVQIMGSIPLSTGGEQFEMMDLKTDRGSAFEAAKGKTVRCMVRPYAFASEGSGNVIGGVSLVKGAEIVLLDEKGNKAGVLASDGPTPRGKATA